MFYFLFTILFNLSIFFILFCFSIYYAMEFVIEKQYLLHLFTIRMRIELDFNMHLINI